MCTHNELMIILEQMANIYHSVYGSAIAHGDRAHLQEGLKTIWDKSSNLELKYGTIVSPTVIPFDEYENYKKDLPYYRNIEAEGIDIFAE